ncbi:carbohydrate ABC transporter permease [Streptomyces sp. N35]|uniref:carbohydrate ABC transporter permease n=1 Tax=Streptomyces sp. N35 TaxID=2795730 RepID=UPI0018F34C72|nr:carbohydrate ABC transporter permease [Streptomyces sp. N35]
MSESSAASEFSGPAGPETPAKAAPIAAPGRAGAPPQRPLAPRIATASGGGVLRVFLILMALLWLTPTLGLLVSSFRDPGAMTESGWWTVFSEPSQFTSELYSTLLGNDAITDSLLNTVWITVPSTVLVVVIGAMAGYAFAWMDFKGRDWWFVAVVGLLVVPIQIALIPLARLFGDIGVFGSIVGPILFHVGFGLPFAVFLLRNFFAEIPRELLEAARLDGAGEIRLFFTVVMPLAGPALASLAIFQFLWVWNDLLVALIFTDTSSQPLTVALTRETRAFSQNIETLAPGAFLSLVIPLAVFFAFQRQFVSGVMAGAVK